MNFLSKLSPRKKNKEETKEEPKFTLVEVEYDGDIMDISDIEHGRIVIRNGDFEWFAFEWKDNQISKIIIPWVIVGKIALPPPGQILKLKHDKGRINEKDRISKAHN